MANTCKYLGREATGLEREAAGKSHSKRWKLCMHPEKPHGELVCACLATPQSQRCNMECPGFSMLAKYAKFGLNEELHNGLIDSLSKTNPPDYFGSGAGDGVLYVGGGKYWVGIVVGIKLLRENGYDGPIQVWNRGDLEPVNPDDVQGCGVDFYDTLSITERYSSSSNILTYAHDKYGGWSAKAFALSYTNLDRVLYLDADAYCVSNPTPLFETLDSKAFVFWQDLPHQHKSIRWQNVYPKSNGEGCPPVQGGQLLIDRHNAIPLLNVFRYICENGDKYWISSPRRLMYGDQDAWRVAMAMGYSNFQSLGRAEWDKVAFVCKYKNTPYVVHRCNSKLFTHEHIPERNQKYSAPHANLPLEKRVFELFAGQCVKHPKHATDVFNNIYKKNLWGGGSGTGSTLREGQLYIDKINTLLLTNPKVSTIVDIGCGDGLLGSRFQVPRYIGVDTSDAIIEQCSKRYPNNTYVHSDITSSVANLPDGDWLVCKDVFHHWPTETIINFLTELEQNNRWKKWIFTCDDRETGVTNCILGGYRAIRLDGPQLKRFGLKRVGDVHHKGMYIRSFDV